MAVSSFMYGQIVNVGDAQDARAFGQRGWNAHPVGHAVGGGTVPFMDRKGASLGASSRGTASRSPCV